MAHDNTLRALSRESSAALGAVESCQVKLGNALTELPPCATGTELRCPVVRDTRDDLERRAEERREFLVDRAILGDLELAHAQQNTRVRVPPGLRHETIAQRVA